MVVAVLTTQHITSTVTAVTANVTPVDEYEIFGSHQDLLGNESGPNTSNLTQQHPTSADDYEDEEEDSVTTENVVVDEAHGDHSKSADVPPADVLTEHLGTEKDQVLYS